MRRQHDPDWQLDGSITVFDNNRRRGHSRIKKIDPTTNNFRTVTKNFEEGFYSKTAGNHQVLPSGNILVASTHQGRAVEITPEGKVALNGFNFNSNAILSAVLLTGYTLNTTTGEVEIVDFVPSQNLSKPEGATHVSLTSGFLNLDFSTSDNDLVLSPVTNLAIDAVISTVTLTPPSVPTGTGNAFYFLKVAFYQEVNSIQYALNNGAYNALQLLEIL